MSDRGKQFGWAALAVALLGACVVTAQNAGDSLERGFQNPPDSAKPRVWWHWMNGNITKEGIKADLEWMKRVGIGGFQNFDAALTTPQVVEKRLVYMTPEWKDAFKLRRHHWPTSWAWRWRSPVRPDGARAAVPGCRPRRR